jgi:DNA-binding beta-propeller fold protein YncE
VAATLLCAATASAGLLDELKVKREAVYEFVQKPTLERDGDNRTIRFETKGLCDVTIVVENAEGRIIRHLASGVLGPNAPRPFQKNSRRQVVVWDGKNDYREYVDDTTGFTVRVSLGLKPQFEKSLYWHDWRRNGRWLNPKIAVKPEGVYVYEGDGVEQVRLYGHDGEYRRTVYPFRSDKLKDVKGLKWLTTPDGYRAPKKQGYWKCTFLLGGRECTTTGPGSSDTAFTVSNGAIAIVGKRLTRLTTDGSTGPYALEGPACGGKYQYGSRTRGPVPPRSVALSPDGKWLYLTGYYLDIMATKLDMNARICFGSGVYRMRFDGKEPAKLWLGNDLAGKSDDRFNRPLSVCVDAKGRVYVADNYNDRVQVFSPAGKLVRSIPIVGPAAVQIHHKTQEVYVFTWDCIMGGPSIRKAVKTTLSIFEPVDKGAKLKKTIPFPVAGYGGWHAYSRFNLDPIPIRAALNSWTDPPTVWTVNSVRDFHKGVRVYEIRDGKLVLKRDTHKEVMQAVARWQSPWLNRQRLYVDPTDGTLYLAEADRGVGKAFSTLLRIDPDRGRCKEIPLPMSAEDMVLDSRQRVYLRTTEMIGRYDLSTWRQVPFDYGEKRSTSFSYDCKSDHLTSGLVLPSNKPVCWHQQGFDVNFDGEIAVFCHNTKKPTRKPLSSWDGRRSGPDQGRVYEPEIYPGRPRYGELHVFDKHGKVRHEDVVQGLTSGHGTQMDAEGSLYVLIRGPRVYADGEKVFGGNEATLIKFKAGSKGRILASGRTPINLPPAMKPKRPPDLRMFPYGDMWVENADWMYSGIGYAPGGCQCWNCRFDLDYLGRSFVPENLRSQLAVLDTNGNLITRIGRYGNVDEGKPLAPARHEPPNTKPIGGDEVSLMYANYVATHTDRRLFIADAGNMRIVCVKLAYHTSQVLKLREADGDGAAR